MALKAVEQRLAKGRAIISLAVVIQAHKDLVEQFLSGKIYTDAEAYVARHESVKFTDNFERQAFFLFLNSLAFSNQRLSFNKVLDYAKFLDSLAKKVKGKNAEELLKSAVDVVVGQRESFYFVENKSIDKVLAAIKQNQPLLGDCMGMTTLYALLLLAHKVEPQINSLNVLTKAGVQPHVRLVLNGRKYETTSKTLSGNFSQESVVSVIGGVDLLISQILYAKFLKEVPSDNLEYSLDTYNLLRVARAHYFLAQPSSKVHNILWLHYSAILNRSLIEIDKKYRFDLPEEYDQLLLKIRFYVAQFLNILEELLRQAESGKLLLDQNELNHLKHVLNFLADNQNLYVESGNKEHLEIINRLKEISKKVLELL